jgi:hypothetical protein
MTYTVMSNESSVNSRATVSLLVQTEAIYEGMELVAGRSKLSSLIRQAGKK